MINRVLCILMKEIENMKIDNVALLGSDKKQIVMQLGRIIVSKYIVNSKNEADTLYIYNNIADLTVENTIDVSQVVNTVNNDILSIVGTGILNLFITLVRYISSSNFLNLYNT